MELSSIRYPGALRLLPSCEESLHNATVVPLMLLNFVENTVKYEVVMGKVLDIHIDVTAREKISAPAFISVSGIPDAVFGGYACRAAKS